MLEFGGGWYDGCPYRRGGAIEDRGGDWGDASTSQGWPANPQELGEGRGTDSPSWSSEGSTPASILVSDSQPPELWDSTFLFKPPVARGLGRCLQREAHPQGPMTPGGVELAPCALQPAWLYSLPLF